MVTKPSRNLETFPNPNPGRDYIIEIETAEFTCLCPKTGQPDFATLHLEYVPDRLCVELKSLKLYFWSYRDQGAYHEAVTHAIVDDLVSALTPRYLRLRAAFNVRGGIGTTVEVEHRAPGWSPAPPAPELPHTPPEPAGGQVAAADTAGDGPAPAPPSLPGGQRFRMVARARRLPEAPPPAPASEAPAVPATRRAVRDVCLGIDLGTTGCRVAAAGATGELLAQAEAPITAPLRDNDQVTQDPELWWSAVRHCLEELLRHIDARRVKAIAVDGTSGTLLMCDAHGAPLGPAIMYNDRRAVDQAKRIAAKGAPDCGAHGTGSSLAKLMWLQDRKLDKRAAHALHQADWVSGRLTGRWGHSDYHNCLKLGFDARTGSWPKWFTGLGIETTLLPEVHAPGATVATLDAAVARDLGLAPEVRLMAGTTDGVASFLAAGARAPGHGVTALGSTLVLKLVSDKPVFSADHGVYSHRLGNYWLAGGASNSGGAALLQYFKETQMQEMTPLLDPEHFTGLRYYPLPDVGERFPVNNPALHPRLDPLPGNSVTFFQGMLEGIAVIEAQGYALLATLGAPPLTRVWTTGGGAMNAAWGRIRERTLHVKMERARAESAAYGAAMLAAGVVAESFS